MKKRYYIQPQQEVTDICIAAPLMAGSITVNAGDTGIIDGGGGDEPALAPPLETDPVKQLLGI